MLTAAQTVALRERWDELAGLLQAAGDVVGLSSGADNAAAAWESTLTQLRNAVSRLGPGGELGRGLAAGTVEPSRWAAVADSTGWGLAQLLNEVEEGRYSSVRVWREVVVPTASEAAALASAALPAASSALRWVVVGLVAYAAVQALRVLR